jgi:hypothetical protein
MAQKEASMSFDSPPYIARLEDEDNDPSGPRDALDLFTAAAAEVGIIRPGDKLDQMMVEFALRIVGMAGAIGDNYLQPESAIGDTVGDRIRGELGMSERA